MIINTQLSGGGARINVTILNSPAAYPALSVTRNKLAAAALGDGSVIFAGGQNTGYSTVADRYDVNGTRTTATPLGIARGGLAGASGGQGWAFFAGGYKGDGVGFSAAANYYSPSGTMSSATALAETASTPSGTTDGAGRVVISGGANEAGALNIVNRYDLAGTRTTLTNLPAARRRHASASDAEGNVWIGGGHVSVSSVLRPQVYRYSLSGTVTTMTSLPTPSHSLWAAQNGAGGVIFAGGNTDPTTIDAGSPTNAAVYYAPSGTVTILTPLSAARSQVVGGMDAKGNSIFAGGGGGKVVDSYSPSFARTTLPALSAGSSDGAAAVNGNGYLIVGGSADGSVDRVGVGLKNINIPAYSAYKFNEHASEQPAQSVEREIRVDTPNTGYFRQVPTNITL
jgi:hypothetical protein